MARRSVACAGHPLAAQAGITTLQRGGNAVDAAIAIAAALNVAEPHMSGVGGDGFIMVYWRDTGAVAVANGTGAAPLAAMREAYQPDGIPMRGMRSASVPGLVDAWLAAHARYGALPLAQALEPAIELADEGCPVSHRLAEAIAAAPVLLKFPSSAAIFAPAGRPLRASELLRNPDLARTFRRLEAEGRNAFYQGEIARAVARCSADHGGLLSLDDLARHRMRWQDPISTTYRGVTVYEAPPNSSGHVLLQELNLVELFDLPALGCNTAASVHLMVEAKRLAFADRERYVADPDSLEIPLAGLLAKDYARERGALIDLEHALLVPVEGGDPWPWDGASGAAGRESDRNAAYRRHPTPDPRIPEETTCFAVVDQWGNAVCQLQSLQSAFGSGLVVEGTGILLNNRMTYWHLDPDHPNCLAPGKRVRHTMNPVLVFRGDRLLLALGTPGADTQVQTNLQLVTHVLDFGLTPVEAVEAPRWRHVQDPMESTVPHTCRDALQLEARFPEETRAGLARRGHPVEVIGDWAGPGSAVLIYVDGETGVLHGAADPRRDGYAIGW